MTENPTNPTDNTTPKSDAAKAEDCEVSPVLALRMSFHDRFWYVADRVCPPVMVFFLAVFLLCFLLEFHRGDTTINVSLLILVIMFVFSFCVQIKRVLDLSVKIKIPVGTLITKWYSILCEKRIPTWRMSMLLMLFSFFLLTLMMEICTQSVDEQDTNLVGIFLCSLLFSEIMAYETSVQILETGARIIKVADCSASSPAQTTGEQATYSENINESITAPIAELNKLPVVPETVAEQEDILDLLEKEEGRWVSQDDFLDHDINANRGTFAEKSLKTYRETRNVMWSKKNPAIGRDKVGNFLKRTGTNPRNYRYQYFLLRKFDKQ